MTPRTLFAWLLLGIVLLAGIFFTYHIVDASANDVSSFQEVNPIVPNNAFPSHPSNSTEDTIYEPLDAPVVVHEMPTVVGQTEEDLRATRQVSETPPTVEYPEPEAQDPLETVAHGESEFGDNLRHPEQTIELHPPMGTMRVPASGLGSEDLPSHGGHQSVQYSPELAQNGGEFMSGIFAYDSSDGGGTAFSMI
jgi:hypothetical protein